MKPHIFFDFDEMKFHTTPALVAYINRRWNITSTPEDYINNGDHLDTIIKKYRKENAPSWDEAYKDLGQNYAGSILHHETVEPAEHMCTVIKKLSKKYTLWTVTARQRNSLHVIEHLLNKHIPDCISGIHCVWDTNAQGEFIDHSKKDFMEKVPGEKIAFFDDSPKEILKTQSIIPSYLFDPNRLHGQLTDIRNRVHSWKEIGDLLL